MAVAGIPYETDSGILDFHALRTTCLSWLAAANVPLRTLQEFARHSTPTLTMNVYAHTLQGSLGGAAARLPDLSCSPDESMRATGTDHARADEARNESAPKSAPNRARSGANRCDSVRDTKRKMPPHDIEDNTTKIVVKTRIDMQQEELRALGLEPRTYGLKGRCSTN